MKAAMLVERDKADMSSFTFMTRKSTCPGNRVSLVSPARTVRRCGVPFSGLKTCMHPHLKCHGGEGLLDQVVLGGEDRNGGIYIADTVECSPRAS